MINKVTRIVITKGRENCQVLGNLHKRYKAGGEVEKENIHPETNEPTVEKRNFRKNQDNIEKVVDSLTSEESINVFLARQRLKFVKGNLNKQEMKDSMFLELNIAAHNIDGIASVLSIQKLYNLLEFINENSIDIMAKIACINLFKIL
ncbi:unnamed protein product [Rhizophagus irregularis]|uniref:Uncharacterized protein n=1 Tax=Rhizophagus irregularis TaxID=588596 RepID=A0A916EEE6_9GLOM|nr:unnamed protein product [Rhizophagus irregularis]